MDNFYILSIVFYVKHLLADIEFQTTYMLNKGKGGLDWILPLIYHASVHGLGTLIIVMSLGKYSMMWLALLDMVIHFIIDRLKVLIQRWWPKCSSVSEKSFHRVYNLDQVAHHLTHLLIIYFLMS